MGGRAFWHEEAARFYDHHGWTYTMIAAHYGVTPSAAYYALSKSAWARGKPMRAPYTRAEINQRYKARRRAEKLLQQAEAKHMQRRSSAHTGIA